ncbi:Beta-carotene 3-hydroxylase, chloroplastic [Dichanthelium oligosanthes]|uniref:beta-carotene 3-hydroxylase n=1 Tax=Dichanthelium oligosanthes TaxID=888268 RepID=A0A1E5WJQ7_9POAL|nr:Beta-carotene 3-hydroxylase, chloroplastic [Dichanthelium oligosanthes]
MAVARLVAAPFPVAASRARGLQPAASGSRAAPRLALAAPLSLWVRAAARRAVPARVGVAADDEAIVGGEAADDGEGDAEAEAARLAVAERAARKQSERRTYLVAAVMSSLGITSMAAAAVYYRFAWQMEGGEIPVTEMVGTFALSVGAAVGMEFWARWAHRALWHASLWDMHESHHRPRDGPFELNDVFAIINAVPAMSLLAYGFFNRGLVPGLCFGAGLGITLFGMAYMFVHDGLVHRRFPVGPIENVPYFRRVAAAHQIHHMDKFQGVPYGLFLGPKELKEVGGTEELEKEIKKRIKRKGTLDAIQ